ncbi:MAG: hypothetical protein ACKPKO_21655, partial [Candidatus Fonsibacter sp.]
EGYDWESQSTFINGNLVVRNHAGDGCGCGCDNYHFDYTIVIGRIKSHDPKSIRNNKIKKLIK